MIDYCKAWGIPEPEFKHIAGDFVVVFRGKLTEDYLKEPGLNDRQRTAIDYLKEHGRIDRKTDCDICGVGKTVAHEELSYLVDKELIKNGWQG